MAASASGGLLLCIVAAVGLDVYVRVPAIFIYIESFQYCIQHSGGNWQNTLSYTTINTDNIQYTSSNTLHRRPPIAQALFFNSRPTQLI